MGVALKGEKLALATQNEVVVFKGSSPLAPTYPKQPMTYDSLYVPRSVYYTGEIDIHDLEWINDEIWAVNTRFSCLSKINQEFSFEPVWQPSFISSLTPDDRCHLNGLAVEDKKPKYVSVLGISDQAEGWRDSKLNGGAIIDVDSNSVLVDGLPMPHSPRIYNGKLYALLSATGELIEVDRQTGTFKVLKKFNGFVRGMDRIDDYLFIGLSKIRETSSAFADMPIAKQSVFCGVVVLYLPTMSVTGYMKYENSVEEIYDVKILPNVRRPGILSHEAPEHRLALTTPDTTFWAHA